MRVIFVVQHPIEGPTSRFRVYQYIPYLQQQGIVSVVLPFLESAELPIIYGKKQFLKKIAITLWATARRFCHLLQVRKDDIIYLVREAYPFGPPFFEMLFRQRGQKLVFDFDDAIYNPSIAYDNPLDVLRDWNKPRKIILSADHVITGSAYLARYVLAQGYDGSKLTVIPTVVDTTVFRPRPLPKPDDSALTIGWIGTANGTPYLLTLLPVIKRLVERYRHIKILLIGADTFDTQGLPIVFKRWQLAEELSNLQSFDIGLMPLTDDEESRGKCGFKLIQYMSVGIPSVCSPVGANVTIIEEGKSGFFATSQEEWFDKLDRLIADPTLRQTIGKNGRLVAEQSFSFQSQAPKLRQVLQSVLSEPSQQ